MLAAHAIGAQPCAGAGLRRQAPCASVRFPLLGKRSQQSRGTAQAVRQQRSRPAEEVEEEAGAGSSGGFLASSAAHVGSLVTTLLFGAASRIERGTSVCVTCKGTGAVRCKECNATGVLNVPSSRDTGSGLKSLVGTRSKEKEWIVSNRCRKCKGHGRHECAFCDGLGKRHMQPPLGW